MYRIRGRPMGVVLTLVAVLMLLTCSAMAVNQDGNYTVKKIDLLQYAATDGTTAVIAVNHETLVIPANTKKSLDTGEMVLTNMTATTAMTTGDMSVLCTSGYVPGDAGGDYFAQIIIWNKPAPLMANNDMKGHFDIGSRPGPVYGA